MVGASSTVGSVVAMIAMIAAGVLLLAGIGLAVYFFTYKRHINKSLSNGGHGTGGGLRMPSLRTVAVVICVLAVTVYSVLTVASLGDRIDELNGRLNNLYNQLSLMSNHIDEVDKKANSIVTSATYELGECDMKTHRAEVKFIVVPKSTTGEATLSVNVGGETVALTNTGGGRYEGTFSADIFADYGEVILSVDDGNGMRTEPLDIGIYRLFYAYMPTLGIELEGKSPGPGAVLHITTSDAKMGGRLVSAKLVKKTDGENAGEEDITSLIREPGKISDVEVDVPKDAGKYSVYSVYVYAEDSAGYTYEYLAFKYSYSDGIYSLVADGVGPLSIRDADGNVIYGRE